MWIYHNTPHFINEKQETLKGIGFEVSFVPETEEDIQEMQKYLPILQKSLQGFSYRAFGIVNKDNPKDIWNFAQFLFDEMSKVGKVGMSVKLIADSLEEIFAKEEAQNEQLH